MRDIEPMGLPCAASEVRLSFPGRKSFAKDREEKKRELLQRVRVTGADGR
jgi:hypothetical protein